MSFASCVRGVGIRMAAAAILIAPVAALRAQNVPSVTPLSTAGKWHNFVQETFKASTLLGGTISASWSQVRQSTPHYGNGWGPFAERFGAAEADLASQNFFSDFVVASLLHEDPRYFRKGPRYGVWTRARYAVSRMVVIRTDSGRKSFNWANLLGTAMSMGLSNAYYPPRSRTGGAIAANFAVSFAAAGMSNLLPEFWPDIRRHFASHH